jgi:hypothetical protein
MLFPHVGVLILNGVSLIPSSSPSLCGSVAIVLGTQFYRVPPTLGPADMEAKLDAELELHSRKSLQYTVLRPGGLTEEPAGGCQMGQVQIGKTR